MGAQDRAFAAAGRDGLVPSVRAALALLAKAHAYSRDVNCNPWEFAVEIARLLALGATACDLRWLVDKGCIHHAREVTVANDTYRRFEPARNLAFSPQTCFIATDAGLWLAGDEWGTVPILASPSVYPRADGGEAKMRLAPLPVRFVRRDGDCPSFCALREAGGKIGTVPVNMPHWDGVRRVLTVGGRVVKRYRVPSPCQQAILVVFQEEGWPARIDDPLTPLPDHCPKERLRATIKHLNSSQENRLLRFRGDGTGKGIVWELVTAVALRVVGAKPPRRRAA